ncbi:unnamed protein product [Oreochromis niloticus]|nr:unnamed protein product [Mustela putorius furo]
MDPQEKIFGERNGGFWWSLDDAEDQEVLMNMSDQFQPFRDIVSLVCEHGWSKVVMEDQHFSGTIFRFPLRNEASEISDNLYDSDKVVELFDSFIADADLSLLFLKKVTSVSLLHISEDGAVNTRLEVKSSVPTDGVLEPEEESVTEGLTRFKVITVSSEDQKQTKWLLTTCTMKEGVAEDLDLLAKKLSFLPQVDLAFPCGEKRDCSQSRLSCFLPLPNNESNKTGLPVYVNACFGLTDNRRHIKWQEEDQRHDEHALWNEMLMKKVFPQAYIKIIQDAIKLAQKSILPVSSVYNLWPDLTQIQHKEKWHALTLDVFHHLFRQNVAILSLAKDERQFISPSEAVFPCNGPTSTNILSAIKRALVSCGENLVTLPASVAKAINEAYPNPTILKHVTPAFLRAILHRTGVDNITKDDKLSLLEYILGDEQYKELEGLHLLPLSDGSFRYFSYREEDTALIDSHEFPRVLLPFCKHLFIPNDLTPACSAHLKKLARRRKLSDRVSNSLSLKDLPPPEKVIENLSVLKSKALEMVNPDTDVDFKRQLHSIYKHMQDNVSVFVTMMSKETCWLWTHNQFVAPQDLVLEYPNNLDLSSYIGKVPSEFLPYRTLFQRFGRRTVLSNEDILGILYSIQQTIEARQPPFASSSEVKVSIEILNWLWKEKKTVQDDIPVPVIAEGGKFTLKPRSTALFCDVSKNGLKELNCREEEIYVIHEEIPKAAAEWLEIRFLSTHILDPEEIGIEQCGQSEPITMRIKNILKEYDEDSDIFKELIQNAEDAGADVCKFLVDFRVHRDAPESLIDPDMALCQGPCLWAFNNEQFTAEDWKNIVRVGSASKENKAEKIGKFGLGFNTVYHVTDVPSILSGNSLLILDPNVTHLTKHIKYKSNPGIKLDLSQQQLFHCFPGQFGSYENIFDCNFTRKSPPEPYPGTLIKLPFRSEEEAAKSEINPKVYQKHNILDFQHHFSKNSQTHLLFLKNIITLSLQNIPHNGSTPPRENEIETIFSVSKTTVSAMEIPDDTSVSKQRHAEKSLIKLDGKCKEVINCCKISIVKISSQQSNETGVQFWLLYNCFGTDESFKMALHKNKQASFSLPIGGIAVPLQNDPETRKFATLRTDLVGQAFCFLPLPIHTGLPVNVNGTFAVTSNRKGLWETGVKNDWNKALLQDPVVTAYVTVLKALKKMSENKQLVSYCYHSFWPDRKKVTETFKPLVDALYSTISDDSVGPELFSDGEQWFSMNNAIFLHESIENDKKIGDLAVQVCKEYAKGPNHVVPLPLWLRNTFKQAGLEKVLQNRTWNWEKFYREAVFSNLTTMDSKSRDILVLHAIDLHIKEIDNLLLCYACIPTKGGQLQHVRKIVNPTGKVACLFEPKEGRLLGGSENDFRSPKRIQRLLELGMANDHLPLEDITEKAGTINKTWSIDKKKAFVHLRLNNKHLLQTMKHMSSVVFASQKHKDISGILFKLGFMRFDHVFFSEMDRWIYSCLQDELLDVDDESSVLDQVYNINHSEFSHLSNDDMKEFQMFLQSGLSKSKDNQEYKRKLKSLPIFETTQGERVRIDGPKKVFILKIKYSVIFPDLFNLPTNSSIFLKHNSENYTLSQTLNIQVLNDLEYFMKFILPAVHQLTETQILHSLKLLLSLHYSLKERETIISSLKTVKLIRSSQGRLEPASYYFDESVELYKQMLPHERFVPERFWSELCEGDSYIKKQAKQLVRELGMKHVVSADEIIHFAYQLESEAKVNRRLKDMKLKSSLLFREVLNKACNIKIKEQNFLERIADIKFIFPVMIRKELSNYHQPFAAEGTTVKIRGSLIEIKPEHQDLIWSSMPIIDLPVYTTQKLMQMMKNAGAHEEPPPNCVASNIRNICQSPCETDQLIKARAKVFRSSYAYLQAKRFEGNQLAGLPVVLVEKDTKLMRPDDVCLSLSYDLDFRPYLYKITPEDAMYAPFFQKIGVKNKATAEQYCNVLAAVYADSCDKQKLHSNQLRTVKRAVEQLFKLINAQGNETLLENVETLYLPAVDGKLYPSSTLCYNDTVFETKRLEEALENKFLLLEKLSECHLGNDKYKHHQLLQLLPQKFQPKMLSEFTEERAVESKMQPCELGTGCEFIGWFAKHLSSRAFKYGFICLLREQLQGKITQEDASNICEKIFGSIQIICCKTLETTLWLNKQPLPKTDEETDVSVERGQQGCTFYLKHNDDMALKVINEVITTLTKEINALLGNRIASVHLPVLGQLLMCDDLQDVRKTLAKNQIRDSAETESSSFSPAAPGTEIPEEWHDCLDMNVLNNFEEGEYVGYSIDDKYIYAVIVEELPGHNGRYSWRYKVDIGEDEPVEVSCVDLFQLKRQKKVKTERRKCMELELQKKMLKPEENTCMELEPLTGAVPLSSEPSINSLPASVQEAKREIDKCLAEIWKLPEEERHKAIKRLYLRWHPDKNPDRQSLANEAFKYLQNRIDELSKPKAAGSTFSSRNTNFRGFYQQWNQEARYHRNSRERFSRGYRGFHSYNFWTHNENVPRPDREEARRWCRQARCDLNAAHKDTGGGSTEWCLFKVHQAVEKSLIAACYKRNGQHPNSSSISTTAAQVSRYSPQLRDLPEIVKNLQTLGVDPKRTQYPNCHPYPHIPNGQFRSENEMLALNKASELLNKIEAYVN